MDEQMWAVSRCIIILLMEHKKQIWEYMRVSQCYTGSSTEHKQTLFSISVLSHSSWQLYSKLSQIFNHPMFARVNLHSLCSESSHFCVSLQFKLLALLSDMELRLMKGPPKNSSSHLMHQYHKQDILCTSSDSICHAMPQNTFYHLIVFRVCAVFFHEYQELSLFSSTK